MRQPPCCGAAPALVSVNWRKTVPNRSPINTMRKTFERQGLFLSMAAALLLLTVVGIVVPTVITHGKAG
jgi:hypothetical protein